MKTKQQLKMGLALFSAVFFLSFTSLRADVVGFVEDYRATDYDGVYKTIVTPNGKFLYALVGTRTQTNDVLSKLIVHSRDIETGKLTEIETIVVPLSQFESLSDYMVVSPDGNQLYVTTSNGVQHYKINDSGKLNFVNSVTSRDRNHLVISKNGKYLYANGGDSITVIQRTNSGDLNVIDRYTTDLNGHDIAAGIEKLVISPDGKQLYTSGGSRLYVFDINYEKIKNTQALIYKNDTQYNLTPEDTKIDGAGGNGLIISKDGKFIYTAGRSGLRDSISMFKRESSGKLSFIKNIKAPNVSSVKADLAISKNSKFIYAYEPNTLSVWARDSSTGDLTFIGKISKKHRSASDVTIDASPDGRNLYLNIDDDKPVISVYDLRSDLSLVKSGPSGDVAPNGTMSYTLAVTNNGLSDAQNVVVTDNLPAGTSFISGTNNNTNDKCIASGQKVTCKMGKILSGHDFNAIIQVKAPANEGNITNTATVTSDVLDTVTANNTDTAKSTIKKGGSSLPPVKDGGSKGGSKGGGSLPLGLLLLLIPALLRRARVVS